MLINCPECGLQLSDKAASCPHCGYPIQSVKRKSRRRRLPNGFGQISKINSGNLRNKYRAMVTVGKTPEGRPICKILKPQGYFASYNDAYAALVEYNKNPYDLSPAITMSELFDRWYGPHTEKMSYTSAKGIENAWKYCSSIYSMEVKDVRIRHLKLCIENAEREGVPATPTIKYHIKSMFNNLFEYALEYELVERNYAKEFSLPKSVSQKKAELKKSHIPFTDEEMTKIWNCDSKYKYPILVQCYSGWRPGELLDLRVADVDIENWYFRGGKKTVAGINRIVPIHTKIREIVAAEYKASVERGCDYLFESKGYPIDYGKYKYNFAALVKKLGLDPRHRPHDPRVHFVTMAKKYNVDEYTIKLLVGHSVEDLTERVYTKRDLEWLRTEIEKIR